MPSPGGMEQGCIYGAAICVTVTAPSCATDVCVTVTATPDPPIELVSLLYAPSIQYQIITIFVARSVMVPLACSERIIVVREGPGIQLMA